MKQSTITLANKEHDPFGYPRPVMGDKNTPVGTSIFCVIWVPNDHTDRIYLNSISIFLIKPNGIEIAMVHPFRKFAAGYKGKIQNSNKFNYVENSKHPVVEIYIQPIEELEENTLYKVKINAKSKDGASTQNDCWWNFTTSKRKTTKTIKWVKNLDNKPEVNWSGSFFGGLVKPDFCLSAQNCISRYEFLDKANKEHPNAWNLQRDFWLSGFENTPDSYWNILPNIVREKETRHIVSIAHSDGKTGIVLEDFYGHEQYGIKSNRPLQEDYHPGDEVLIADGYNSARAYILEVDNTANAIWCSNFQDPENGWKLKYPHENANYPEMIAPGKFSRGGGFLRRFKPTGTPCYYWERLHYEWDISSKRFNKRLIPGFCDAPGDLSIDGKSWSYPKDYVQLHEVTKTIVSHLIERYGEITSTWIWSVLNEPDIPFFFWHSNDWNNLLKFYDYTVDAILKAFEEYNYDSEFICVGGLELGGIAGTNLKINEFLCHCSPNSQIISGVSQYNAAFQDKRLDGKRSRRTEILCSENKGRGTPVDFVSVHTYNSSKMAAEKLIRAKEIALEIDSAYYEKLWINNFEAVPDWMRLRDPAAVEIYQGNGYFATWIADYMYRLLKKGSQDPRYTKGESILTIWSTPTQNFHGQNDIVREVQVGSYKDNKVDQNLIIPYPEFHLINLISDFNNNFYVFDDWENSGQHIGGFVSQSDREIRVLIYFHIKEDIQSCNLNEFYIILDLKGINYKKSKITEYTFNSFSNSYLNLAKKYNQSGKNIFSNEEIEEVKKQSELQSLEYEKDTDNNRIRIETKLKTNTLVVFIVQNIAEKSELLMIKS